jgi:hypothetical protein
VGPRVERVLNPVFGAGSVGDDCLARPAGAILALVMTDLDTTTTPPAPPPAVEDSPTVLLQTLRRLLDEGRVEIRIEAKRLDHMDSPVASEAEGNIWVYGFLVVACLVGWWAGITAGVVALGLGIALYLTLGKVYIHRRIERRVRDKALVDIDLWRKLWRFPGLTLVAAGAPAGASPACASPDGNWMAFVRAMK